MGEQWYARLKISLQLVSYIFHMHFKAWVILFLGYFYLIEVLLGGRGKLNRRYIYYIIRCGFGGS